MFSSKDVPAVGVSIGIERVFNLLEDKIMAGCKDESGAASGKIRETDTEVIACDILHCSQRLVRVSAPRKLRSLQMLLAWGVKRFYYLYDRLEKATENCLLSVALQCFCKIPADLQDAMMKSSSAGSMLALHLVMCTVQCMLPTVMSHRRLALLLLLCCTCGKLLSNIRPQLTGCCASTLSVFA